MTSDDWYSIHTITAIDSPALIIYKDRVAENIRRLIASIDDVKRLRPHVKTHKSPEVSRMMLEAGIKKFKCATIAEAEMLAVSGAPDILLAYQPVGPKAERLAHLAQKFPGTVFSCLIDDLKAAQHLSAVFEKSNQVIGVYIDLNVGMNRTGILPENALDLFESCRSLKGIQLTGLHAYDGHLRDPDLAIRTKQCDEVFLRVKVLQQAIEKKFNTTLKIVAGGTPTYSIHRTRKEVECSPGTFIYWDKGYEQILPEQHYLHAALVISRIISIPAADTICIDLGHKAIASENPLPNRVYFLNAPDLQPTGHSEEHMVFKTAPGSNYSVGDVLYGVPYHVCPTIALHDEAVVVQDHEVITYWSNLSRKRKISI
jgi:D-serine deaminase-like pyridoxal phosphate-dependent protein